MPARPMRLLVQSLTRLGLHLVPAKRTAVALTLHNIEPQHDEWLGKVLDRLGKQYGFMAPDELRQVCGDGADAPKLLLTFDDGFQSNRRVAEQLLVPRGIKALFFVTAGFIDLPPAAAFAFAQRQFYPSRQLAPGLSAQFAAMSSEELVWLQQNQHHIGAHTASHRKLASLSSVDQHNEIIASADHLERKIGVPVRHFAYPFGTLDSVDQAARALVEARFDCAFSNIRGALRESPGRHFLFRQNLVPGMPMWLVEAIAEGRLDWRYWRTRRQSVQRFRCGNQLA